MSARKSSGRPNDRQGTLGFGKRSRLALRRRRGRTLAFALLLMLAGVAAFGAVYGLHRSEVTISSVTVTGGAYADTAEIKRLVSELIAGSYARLVPRASSFFYPRAMIADSIKVSFPSVDAVSVKLTGLTALAVAVTERAPKARWCPLAEVEGCYLMDASGNVFALADSVAGIAYRGRIDGDPLGQTFLDGEFPALEGFVARVPRATGRTVASVSVDADDDVEVVLDGGGVVRFARASDLERVIGNVAVTFGSKQFASGAPFEYADFRFGDKVYVKWK